MVKGAASSQEEVTLMTKYKFYVYCWWSGVCIEEEVSKIDKIKGNKIFFYNNYLLFETIVYLFQLYFFFLFLPY